jgi:N-acetylmuramoyl-L-alanine amidase
LLPLNKFLQPSWRKFLLSLILLCGLALLLWPARTLRSDNFVFYFPNSRHVIPLEVIGNTKYLPLLQVLNLVGSLNGLQEKRNTLKVAFENTHVELHADDPRIRLDKKTTILSAPVRFSNGRWMVPSDFLSTVLPRLTGQSVEYQAGTSRAFLGDIKPGSFSLRLEPVSSGARLTFQFTDKVTVRPESVNGKWVMFLGDHPIEPLEQSFHFHNPYVSDVRFDDQDGLPKLIITPSAGGLNFYPVLAEGGKVLQADVLRPSPPAPQTPPPSAPPSTTATGPTTPSPSTGAPQEETTAPTGPPLPIVVLDAGHGGDDTGAHSHDGVVEKDLVAQLVAHVRQALLSTRKFRVVLTRAGDVNVTFEQRAATANEAAAAYFLTFHAGDLGGGSPQIAVYTYRPPGESLSLPGGGTRPIFVKWNQVQESYSDQSRQLAETLHQEFAVIAGVTAELPQAAPERTLRSVNAPAVAIELGTLSPDYDAGALTDPAFQLQLSNVVAETLAALLGRGGGA